MCLRLGDRDMNTIITILSVIIVVCLILIFLAATYNHFQDYIIRINEAEVNIDAVLRKRFDLLNKSMGIIKSIVKNDEEILEMIPKLRSQKITNFELDRGLYDAIAEFHALKEKYTDLQNNKEIIKVEINLMESESEIVGLRKYYNDIVTDYNKLVKSTPSNIVAVLKRYKAKDYFDGTNIDKNKGVIKL